MSFCKIDWESLAKEFHMSAELFDSQKFIVCKSVLPKSFCEIIVNYAKFQAMYDFTPEIGSHAQVEGTHSRYADFLMESFLLYLQPIFEEKVEQELIPSYSYYRVYKQGDKLDPHIDRNACEISATLAFGWPSSSPWPFKLSNDKVYIDGTEDCHTPSNEENTIVISLEPGDALIYAGPQVKHWRDPLGSTAYVQAFFHYVYANGPNSAHKYDKRDAIGVPKVTSHFEYFKYSDWMKALQQYLKSRALENQTNE